jgi:hypothetical protein
MNLSIRTEDAQKQMMKDRNVLQNYLNIPIIEVEQLNPRVIALHGIMVPKYRSQGGGMDDFEGTVSYEYDWIGGELVFIDNPYPRPPVGTGKIAFLCDDERDPLGSPMPVPEGAKSGEAFGWNKEFLASHYLENFWNIMDPEIEAEVQQRCFNILVNSGKPGKEARALVEDAAKKQASGSLMVNVNVTRTTMIPRSFTRKMTPEAKQSDLEKSEMFQEMVKQNKELQETVRKLMDKGGKPAELEAMRVKVEKKPEKTKKKGCSREDFLTRMEKGKKKRAELTGNLAG